MNASSPYNSEGIYSKSSKNGEDVYMFYFVVGNAGCRTMTPGTRPVIPENNLTLKKDLQLSPKQKSARSEKVHLWPNPATSSITISSESGLEGIEIYDISGATVLQKRVIGSHSTIVSINNLPSGIYSCKIFCKNGIEYSKLVIQR
jgi:hypothetical protein